ncbi:Zinc finger MYM-type protein 1 [Merluccius polli]|uniref:Zinc finger MYM-type protein 1 n=1 Tax=Merluccius polli TaxID=89951 RepID=A0AA47NN46_MERPO|nr:Zinc finger MYM-type protein 1 [Merluccius polli]
MKPDTQNLRTFCPTRWTVRTGTLKSVIDNYSVLTTAMEEFSEESRDECGRKAGGILAMLEKFSTHFGLRLAYLVFYPTEQLSKTECSRYNTSFYSATESVFEASKDLTEGPQLPRQRRLPKRLGGGDTFESPSEYYRKQYFEVLDLLNNELSRRFDQSDFGLVMDMEKLLVAAASGKQVTLPSSVTSLYAEDFDFDSLRAQLSMLPDTIKTSGIQTKSEKTSVRLISEAMSANPVAKVLQSEVHKLLKLFFTIPVTTASAERSFSTLRHIKTYLHSTMTQRRLNDLMCSHIHRDVLAQVDMTAVAKEFIQQNERRRLVFGKFKDH